MKILMEVNWCGSVDTSVPLKDAVLGALEQLVCSDYTSLGNGCDIAVSKSGATVAMLDIKTVSVFGIEKTFDEIKKESVP